jgi:hypothetical protein
MSKLRICLGDIDEAYPTTAPIIDKVRENSKSDEVILVEIIWADDRIIVHLKSGRQLTAHAINMQFDFDGTIF